jgi:hypothetical protein
MSTKFQPIEIPPGVVSKPTKNMRSSAWAEVNLMRWIEGELQPVGPQSQFNFTFASRCRRIHGWYDLNQVYHVAYVCEQNVYVSTGDLNSPTLVEISPAGGWTPPPAPGMGGYGDLNYGDDLPYPNLPPYPPPAGTTTVYGWPRASGTILAINEIPPVWSVDNMGAILLVMNSEDGRLLEWDPAAPAGTLLTRTANSPLGRCFVVTQERFVMIFGQNQDGTADGGSSRRFGWCDQENRTAWNFSTVTSQAGFLDIEPATPIICADSGRFGTVFFTAKKAYVSRYIGLPYVYNYVELADDCTPWSPASITSTSSYLQWMSQQGMFAFDGTTITPVPCPIRAWITDDIDPANVRFQAFLAHIGQFNELWWFYPQNGQPHNTRVAIQNYREGWWSQGKMSRSAGVTSSYTVQPTFADGTIAMLHEMPTSGTAGGVYINADPPWAETFGLNLTSGAQLITVKQVIPDIKGDMPNVQFQFYSKNSRSLGAKGVWTPPIQIRPDGYVDARTTGRDIRMKLSVVGPHILPFTVGQHLVDFAVRGDR